MKSNKQSCSLIRNWRVNISITITIYLLGGMCLPYRKNVHEKQPWLRDYLHQWKSDTWSRTRAMPHIKTYSQVHDKKAAYFLLTSANLSKAAWGKLNKAGDKLHIMSFEAGVLLLPKFVTKQTHFDIGGDEYSDWSFSYDLLLQNHFKCLGMCCLLNSLL